MSFASRLRLLTLVVTAGAAVFSIGCGSDARQSDAVTVVGTDEPALSADELWARLTSIEPDLVRIENDSGLEHFMREVEVSNQARRSLGLEFWNTHPDDPRRYSWLIRTVYMAPAYPVDLTEWARQETQLGVNVAARGALGRLALAEIPFEFSAPTMHGEDFDMQDLRGKIVLVDHWATTCSSCISAMPRLHEIYEDYKDRGFEVVSIAYDGEEQRKKVLRIEAELSLTWTTLNGEGQWDAIRSKYGYLGFPQYMLLERNGTLYAGSGEIDMGRNLRALLEEMLVAEERQSRLFP